MNPDPETISPTGKHAVVVSSWEARMSLWVDCPTVQVVATGERVFGFADSNWSLSGVRWTGDEVVELGLRKYPGGPASEGLEVRIDCAARRGWVLGMECGLDQVEGLLEAEIRRRSVPVGRPRGAAVPDGASGWLP